MRWDKSRNQSARRQNRGRQSKDRRVVARHPINLIRQQTPTGQCRRYPDAQAHSKLGQGPAQHQTEYPRAIRAQCYADADLAPTLRHRVRSHAVQPNAYQDQRQPAEQFRQSRNKTVLIKIACDLLVHVHEVDYGKVGVDPLTTNRPCGSNPKRWFSRLRSVWVSRPAPFKRTADSATYITTGDQRASDDRSRAEGNQQDGACAGESHSQSARAAQNRQQHALG